MVRSLRARAAGALLLLGVGCAFLQPPRPAPEAAPATLGALGAIAAPAAAWAQLEGSAMFFTKRGDILAESEVIQNVRENPPFFAQWPPLVQIAVPVVILLAIAAAVPLLTGEMLDKETIRRAKRRKKQKKKLLKVLQRQAARAAALDAAEAEAQLEASQAGPGPAR
ncbi:unnamed protein product [Effrenium voratum]|nr:unnamed protein product [Effrenium voratum]